MQQHSLTTINATTSKRNIFLSNYKICTIPKETIFVKLPLHLPLMQVNYSLMQPEISLLHSICRSGVHNTSSKYYITSNIHYAYHYTELALHSEAKIILCKAIRHKHKGICIRHVHVQPFTVRDTKLICHSTEHTAHSYLDGLLMGAMAVPAGDNYYHYHHHHKCNHTAHWSKYCACYPICDWSKFIITVHITKNAHQRQAWFHSNSPNDSVSLDSTCALTREIHN